MAHARTWTELEPALLFGDLHAPFHDQPAVDATCALLSYLRPRYLVSLGDAWDCAQLSGKYRKDPASRMSAGHDLIITRRILEQLWDSAPKHTEKKAVEGNHDARFWKTLWDTAPEYWEIMQSGADLADLLGYTNAGVQYAQGSLTLGDYPKGGRLQVQHGWYVRKWPGQSAHAHIETEGLPIAVGHCHRLCAYPRTWRDRIVWGCECGCLCRMDQAYLEGRQMNWQPGVAIAWISTTKPLVYFDLVPIDKGVAYWNGREFRA